MKIDHVNIVVSDLEKSCTFFESLGFERGLSSELSGKQLETITGLPGFRAEFVTVSLPGDSVNIELIQYYTPEGSRDELLSKPNQIGFRHMAFAVDDIEGLVENLKSQGVEFQSDIQVWEKTGKKLVYFYGPDGILLEFAEYPKSEDL